MDDKLIHKFINKVKDKFIKTNKTYPEVSEYAFSSEEIENINKQNKQKIQELKQNTIINKKENKPNTEEILSKIENHNLEETKDIQEETITKEEITTEEETKEPQKNSFITLNEETQQLIMNKWNEIKLNKIDKDIIDGKDLLNHNYTYSYADDASKFIHYIRKEYEIIICYLIGFNNEKQGIFNKTIFSNKIDDEWKHLNSYIKILEKIRNFKK